MSGFKMLEKMGLSKDRVYSVVSTTRSLSEALEVLRISDSGDHRRKLSYWCKINEVSIEHLNHSGRKGPSYIIRRYTDDFLKEMVEKSNCQSQLCISLGFPPVGSAYRLIGARLKEVYPSGDLPFKIDGTRDSIRRRLTDEQFFVKGVLRNGTNLKSRLIGLGIKDICVICGQLPVWMGHLLVLQVDHIDGNPTNNVKDNLRIICPHCHTQQKTTGRVKKTGVIGRTVLKKEIATKAFKEDILCCQLCGNPKKTKSKTNLCPNCARRSLRKVARPSKEKLLELLTGETSFLALGKQLGVSDQAVRKWCKQFGFDPKKMGRAAKTAKRLQEQYNGGTTS
jgi:protein-arginine kinase activator protein McsA